MPRLRLALVAGVLLAVLLAPGVAHASTGSTIFQRFWDSMITTWKNRTESEAPTWLALIEDGEEIFLGDTADLTELPAVQDAVAAARVAGGILLAFCIVISLGEVTVGQMTGSGMPLTAWFWRLLVATVMTFGSLPVTGAVVRFCNYLLHEVRTYLDMHYTATTADLWEGLSDLLLRETHVLLILLFLAVLFVLLLLMWFLYGGVRVAEVIIHMLLWPLTWPLYLIPSLEDVPKTATRGFIMWAALPIMVVLMLRTAIRMVIGGTTWGTIWAFVPAICLLGMTLFLPAAVRRVFGQGHTGTEVVVTAAKVLAGLKFAAIAGAAGGTAALSAAAPVGGAAGVAATPMRPTTAAASASGGLGALAAPGTLDSTAPWARTRPIPHPPPPPPPDMPSGETPLALYQEPKADNYDLIGAPTPLGRMDIIGRRWAGQKVQYTVDPAAYAGLPQIAFTRDETGWWQPVGRMHPDGRIDFFSAGDDAENLPRFRLDHPPPPDDTPPKGEGDT